MQLMIQALMENWEELMSAIYLPDAESFIAAISASSNYLRSKT